VGIGIKRSRLIFIFYRMPDSIKIHAGGRICVDLSCRKNPTKNLILFCNRIVKMKVALKVQQGWGALQFRVASFCQKTGIFTVKKAHQYLLRK
jgi:hypothetical protein